MAEPTLTDLPPEIIVRIFSNLNAKDVPNVSCVCKAFRNVMLVDQIWESWCREDYNFRSLEEWGASYQAVYQHVLHKYGCLLNIRTFSSDLTPYGGVYIIKVGKGQMDIEEAVPPPDPCVELPVTLKCRYSIGLDPSGKSAVVQCCQEPGLTHSARAEVLSEERCVIFTCSHQHLHNAGTMVDMNAKFFAWLRTQTTTSPHQVLASQGMLRGLQDKFNRTYQYNLKLKLSCMQVPEPSTDCSSTVHVLPGLYKGTYGAHGIEIILMDYVSEATGKTFLTGTKVTGDPNVPAREGSLYVDLERPMVLTEEQQESLDLLLDIDLPEVSPAVLAAGLPRQPFNIPRDCDNRSIKTPSTCLARYHGKGQIAYNNFRNPTKSMGHFVVFSETSFGFLWIALGTFSVYHRIDPSFL